MAIPITFAGFEFATFIDNNIINSFSIPSIVNIIYIYIYIDWEFDMLRGINKL